MRRIFLKVILILIALLLLSGCWDRVEIEERGFVVGIGVDLAKEEIQDKKGIKVGDKYIKLTYQNVVPAGLGSPTQGGGNVKAFRNISETGSSAFEITRKLSGELSRTPFFEHLKVIVLSKDFVSHPFFLSNILDYYLRDHEMRRGTKIFVAENDAKEIFEFVPKNEKIPAIYLDSLSENFYKNAEIMKPVRIGDIHEKMIGDRSFMVPLLNKKKDTIVVNGVAVFHGHNNRMVGTLKNGEFVGVNLATGEATGGYLETNYKNDLYVYEIRNSKVKITGNLNDKNHLIFNIHIQLDGSLSEAVSSKSINFQNEKVMKKLENAFEHRVEFLVRDATEKLQNDLSADVLRLDEYMIKHDYDLWKQIKDDWEHGEKYFSSSSVNVDADVNIEGIGSIIQSTTTESRD